MAGLYLHIPFCRRKCSYCDFYSVEGTQADLQDYPDLLIQQLALEAERYSDTRIETIYFGGGTPSLLPADDIGRILEQAHKFFEITADAEISLEANPGTVTSESLTGYRSAGVNRLSLGLQTCSDRQLEKLGRLHDHQDGLDAVKAARQAGFDNLSLDLMFALAGQTLNELAGELDAYLELSPEHMSCYGLTAEPHTELHRQVSIGEISLPDDGFYADAYQLIHDRLVAAGLEHYEIANYARSGYRCRHNEAYWQRKAYIGVGAGAHSFQDVDWGSRWQIPDDIDGYRQKLSAGQLPAELLETFDRNGALSETIYLALRTREGLSDEDLYSHFGEKLETAFAEGFSACSRWLSNDSGRWTFSLDGWLLYDRLIQHFL